jgi:DUF4097 and DUF4098 domain-containing protein YvlB
MKFLITLLVAAYTTVTFAQTHTEKIVREITFEKVSEANALMIANINGDVKVQGYDGDKILIEVNKWVAGKTAARLEKGKTELQLGVINRADSIILYVVNGCTSFGKGQRFGDGWNKGWGYNWNCNEGHCETDYDYKMDFMVKVPRRISVTANTINEGEIDVQNVSGSIRANNINGGIKLANLEREAVASTINGDVDVEYTSNPSKDCRFYSLNGDINAFFRKGLAANLSFESFNGEFFTNINGIDQLPAILEKSEKGEGIHYKVNGNLYKIGKGGPLLDFETFNGNVYLKEK